MQLYNMFYSVSTKIKQTILTHFLDEILKLLIKQYTFLKFCVQCSRFSLFTVEDMNLLIHESCPVLIRKV